MHHALNTNFFFSEDSYGARALFSLQYWICIHLLVVSGVSWPYGTVDNYPVIIGLLC